MEAGALINGLVVRLKMVFSCLVAACGSLRAPKGYSHKCCSCGIPRTNNTIIVGAGVIGLSTAYWHSQATRKTGQKIFVLESRNECFQGASGYNSGLISYHWFSGGLRLLADHSFGLYQRLAKKSPDFKSACAYHENSLFQAHRGKAVTDSRAPKWITIDKEWHLEPEPAGQHLQYSNSNDGEDLHNNPSSATINPGALGRWLYQRCLENDVCIETDCTLFQVHRCNCGKVRSVLVKSVRGILEYKCDNLVFTTGSRTPQLFRDLFPEFTHDFHETTNSGNWIIVKNAAAAKTRKCAEVILDDIVGHQLEFVGREDHTTGDFVIWVCGLNDEDSEPDRVGDQAEPDEDAINRLCEYVKKYLRPKESALQQGFEVLQKGRTYRPTLGRELPIVTFLSCKDLGGSHFSKRPARHGRRDGEKSGVWVCTGHGKYGITLGLGSGKLISQMILGEKPDLDVTPLGFRP